MTNVDATIVLAEEPSLGDNAEDHIRRRILHALSIYPKLSPSMLQVGIGTGLPPKLWHVVLETMVERGEVDRRQVKETNPTTGRDQVYTIISLAPETIQV
jgi:hypothetical protein